MRPVDDALFHACPREHWEQGLARDRYPAKTLSPGAFIHLSTRAQIRRSVALHCAEHRDLVLLVLAPQRLGSALRWEASREGEDFPHLYAHVDPRAVTQVIPLPLGPEGTHRFPKDF